MKAKYLYENALLAEASYGKLQNIFTINDLTTSLTRIGNDDDEPDDPDKGFSKSQAEEFVKHWKVVHHQPDTDSGFSATLFKSTDATAAQPYILAIRGTDGLQDLIVTDVSDIVTDGLAIDQIVDLFNYWKSLITPKGETFIGYRLETLEAETFALNLIKKGDLFIPDFNMSASTFLAWLHSRDDIIIDNRLGLERVRTVVPVIPTAGDSDFSGILENPLSIQEMKAVTGHSLGGHLSAALTRLVPGIEAVTINGAGFPTGHIPGLGGDAEVNIRNLFGMLGGASSFDSARILNIFGEKMPEFVTQNNLFGLVQQGGHEPIFIEQTPWYGNVLGHGSSQMTDSLAVYDILLQLDVDLDNMSVSEIFSKFNPIFEQTCIEDDKTLETFIHALGHFLQVETTDAIDDRDQLYSNLTAINNKLYDDPYVDNPILKSEYQNLQIVDMNGYTHEHDAIDAEEQRAYHYALRRLNTFAITGNPDLYLPHNKNGELDQFDQTTRNGELSLNYLRDRERFLALMIERNQNNTSVKGEQIEFYDVSTGIAAQYDNAHPGERSRYHFGSEGNDVLDQGGSNKDHLYGDMGDDTLIGNGNDDILEGGSGNDLYIYRTGDGIDTIFDKDGLGSIRYDGITIDGGSRIGDDQYLSDDGRFTYVLDRSNEDNQILIINGRLRITHFINGHLGINLTDAWEVNQPEPVVSVTGTPQADAFDTDYDGNHYDAAGVLYGLDGNDFIGGSTGEDRAHGDAGQDWIATGNGDDWIDGGTGDDLLYTGAGGDIALGGEGNDIIVNNHLSFLESDGSADWDILIWRDIGQHFHAQSLGLVQYSNGIWDFQVDANWPQHSFEGTSVNGDHYVYDALNHSITYTGPGHEQGIRFNLSLNIYSVPDVDDGNDNLSGGAGDDLLAGYTGNDTLTGGIGDDQLNGGDGNDVALGGSDNDQIIGGSGDDYLSGGEGIDILLGENGVDHLFGDRGDDELQGGDETDYLFGGEGNDLLAGQAGDDELWGDKGNDSLLGGEGSDILKGGIDKDVLFGESGNDRLDGNEGDDQLQGGMGSDILNGGSGVDTLLGGFDDDNYIFSLGDGHDLIMDESGDTDILTLNGVFTHNINFISDNGNLIIHIPHTNDQINIIDWFGSDSIEQVIFTDNTILNRDQIQELLDLNSIHGTDRDDSLTGTDSDDYIGGGQGNDVIAGHGGNDVLIGGQGNDYLDGGPGDDRYLFSSNSGYDVIEDKSGVSQIALSDHHPEQMTATVMDESLVISFDTGDKIQILGWKELSPEQFSFVFKDGETLSGLSLAGIIQEDHTFDLNTIGTFRGTDDNDIFNIASSNLSVDGGLGNDTYYIQPQVEELDLSDPSGVDTLVLEGNPDNTLDLTMKDGNLTISFGDHKTNIDEWEINQIEYIILPENNVLTGDSLYSRINHTPTEGDPIGILTTTEEVHFTYTLPENSFFDLDNDLLTYNVALNDGSNIPDWLSFDPDTRTFSGTPETAEQTTYSILITATDKDGESATSEFSLQVNSKPEREAVFFDSFFYSYMRGFEGSKLSSAGDMNGDGYEDLLILNYQMSPATSFIVFGDNDNSLSSTTIGRNIQYVTDKTHGLSESLRYHHIEPLGDIDCDGYDDLGFVEYEDEEKTIPLFSTIIYGRRNIINCHIDMDEIFSDENAKYYTYLEGIQGIKNVGNLNGDLYDDMLITKNEEYYILEGQFGGFGSLLPESSLYLLDNYPYRNKILLDYIGTQSDNDTQVTDFNGDGVVDTVWIEESKLKIAHGSDSINSATADYVFHVVDIPGYETVSVNIETPLEGRMSDINGDGRDDICIVVSSHTRKYLPDSDRYTELFTRNLYVLFGQELDLPINVYSDNLDINNGIHIVLPNGYSSLYNYSINTNTDINSDGLNDIALASINGWDYGFGETFLNILYGNDFNDLAIDGTDGSDVLFLDDNGNLYARGGDDIIDLINEFQEANVYAGLGDDIVTVDSEQNEDIYINAGPGDDILQVNKINADSIYRLEGGNGSDTFILPSDLGVSGYKVSIRDLTPQLSLDANILRLGPGIESDALNIGYGSLYIDFGGNLQVHLESFDPQHVLEGPRDIEIFEFHDGTTITYEELVSLGFDHAGTDSADQLHGTSVTDRIYGYSGDDFMVGGRGDDTLDGGSGNDVYFFNLGDGIDTIIDNKHLETYNHIQFGKDIFLEDLKIVQSASYLTIEYGFAGDGIQIRTPDEASGNASEAIASLVFDDGSRVTMAELLPQDVIGEHITGSSGFDQLTGTDANDIIEGLSGKDRIFAGEGNDTLIGGKGRDTLYGEGGNDIFIIEGSDRAYDRFSGGGGYDSILGGPEDDTIRLHRFDESNSIEKIDGGPGINRISGTRGRDHIDINKVLVSNIDCIDAGPRSDTIIGSSHDDVIIGGRGSDRLYGHDGDDIYCFGRGDGRDFILDSSSNEQGDKIRFEADIGHDQLWFEKVNDDLRIKIIGTANQVTIENWYIGEQYQIEAITTDEGYKLLNTQVDQMVQAMAAFHRPRGGELSLPQEMHDQLAPMLAVSWQAV